MSQAGRKMLKCGFGRKLLRRASDRWIENVGLMNEAVLQKLEDSDNLEYSAPSRTQTERTHLET